MPTTGAFIGRLAEIAISNAASSDVTTATYVATEKMYSPNLSPSQATARVSSNDSSGNEEYLPTWKDATMSFSLVTDENGTGQEHYWTAYLASETRAFRLRPRGDSSGERQYRFLGIITALNYVGDRDGAAEYSVTIQRTGAFTRDTQ